MVPHCPNCGTELPHNPRRCPVCDYDQDLHRAKEAREALVGLLPKDALEKAADYLTSNGATVTNRTENSISFTHHKEPDAAVFIVLLLLGILPGILYALLTKRNVNFMVTARPAQGGCRLHFGGEFGTDYKEYLRWLRSLPAPNPEISPAEEEPHIDIDSPTQIQKLAKLRDAGIVTEEEFQAKKRDLLDRM